MWTLEIYRRRRTALAVWVTPLLRSRVVCGPSPHFTLLCVYRRRNVEHVAELCRSALAAGGSIRLWSLDGGTHPELSPHTVGVSTGDRPVLLNTLERAAPTGPDEWIIVADDDITIDTSLAMLVDIAAAAHLDIAQPAHSQHSFTSFPHALAKPLSIARQTEFVEVGPVVVISPRARPLVFPMDETHRMGVGSELAWMDFRRIGVELGIVDCVTIRHLGVPGADYGGPLDDILDRIDAVGGPRRLRTVHATWYPHRRRPPWSKESDPAG